MIHAIILDLHFTNCAHEPCLYVHKYSKTPVYLLRQVDDFTIAAHSVEYATTFLHSIQSKLKQPLEYLGIINMYNGLNITQSQHFIKISCSTYIKKILNGHHWDTPNKSSPTKTPLPSDSTFIK